MGKGTPQTEKSKKFHLSLDTWAILVALAAALLVRTGIIPHVTW